jgi:HEAT repeat protein
MNTYPALTISLLSQLTNRELQANYLNHLDRTSEVASLLTEITDPDLALRIVNLALEVDLNLGASLTSSLAPALQQIIVDGIDRLEVPTTLKIELLRRTKSKAAIVYLCDLFAVKNQYQRTSIYDHDRERDAIVYESMDAIIDLDPNVAAALLIENLNSNGFYSLSGDRLSRLATVEADTPMLNELTKPEAIDALGSVLERALKSGCNIHVDALNILGKIGTELAIAKIRDIIHEEEYLWFNIGWIQGLGIVGDAPMVEQLLRLLYFADEYIWHTPSESSEENDKYYERQANELRCEAILGIERLGGNLAFEILHQSLYWIIDSKEYPNPLEGITQALFRLDRDRIFIALESAIHHSDDPTIRMRVAKLLGLWYVEIEDRNLSILLDALDDPDPNVYERIISSIKMIILYAQNTDDPRQMIDVNITPKLLTIATTNPTIVAAKFPHNLDTKDIGDRVVQRELLERGNLDFINLLNISQLNILIADIELVSILKRSDICIADIRTRAIIQMGKLGENSVLPKLISLLEDSEYSIRAAAVEGIAELGTIDTIPTLLSLASHPELAMELIWRLELMRKGNRKTPILDLLLADRELASNLLDVAEKTIVDIALEESEHNVMPVLCLGAIGSTNEAVLVIDKLIKDGYHASHFASRSLARINNKLAINKISEYLTSGDFPTSMSGELSQVYRLGIVPDLWKCERNHYSGSVFDIIETIQEKEGLYNPDFSDRSHPLFEPYTARLRYFLLGSTGI